MTEVVGVRFKRVGKIYYFSPNNIDVKKGDFLIVETSRGLEFGTAITDIMSISEENIAAPLKNVIKIADDEDIFIHRENKERAKEAQEICKKKISEHELNMKLISTEYTFDNSKLIFYFTSEDRVDFRNLVKDLAAIFKTRIELRQIGVRDEAKSIGGLGCCGRETCCSSYLCEFSPVTIKMAKDQNFSLNPTKISGVCGRLMCCLSFEEEGYEYLLSKMPNVGDKIETKFGIGIVKQIVPLEEQVVVRFENEDEITEEIVKVSDIVNM